MKVQEWDYSDRPMYFVLVSTQVGTKVAGEYSDPVAADAKFKALAADGRYPWLLVVTRIIGTIEAVEAVEETG